MFVIRVTKEGGVTGYGEALLKSNGVVQTFATRAEAETRAADYRRSMNHQYAVAFYTATVIEKSEGCYGER